LPAIGGKAGGFPIIECLSLAGAGEFFLLLTDVSISYMLAPISYCTKLAMSSKKKPATPRKHHSGVKHLKSKDLDIPSHFQRAFALHQSGNMDQAELMYRQILVKDPAQPDALHYLGMILQTKGNGKEAVKLFDRALKSHPNNPACYANRAVALFKLGQTEAALLDYDHAITLEPNLSEAYFNKGDAMHSLDRHEEALACYDRAIAIRDNYPTAHLGRGVVLESMGRFGEALKSYQCAAKLKPDYAEAHHAEALVLLKQADYAAGWTKYEWRWQMEDNKLPQHLQAQLNKPLWLGSGSLDGKTIYLHAEQGFGDTIQFCRYVYQVAELGANIVLSVPSALKPLMGHFPNVSLLLDSNEKLDAFDCHCPLMSLPLALQTRLDTIPSKVPYLFSQPDKIASWQKRLGERVMPRIGLAWSGNIKPDPKRAIPLCYLLNLFAGDKALFSLQKELRPNDQRVFDEQTSLSHFGGQLNDFGDTAALIEHMDLIISVDTSVAHLAGAMGKPVWLLLPFNSDWRWLLERDDSPWYPSVRLFRQENSDDWEGVLAKVKAALAVHSF